MVAGRSLPAVHQVRDYVRNGGSARFVEESASFWETWTKREACRTPPKDLSERAKDVYRTSVILMRQSIATNGSIIASPDTRSLVAAGDTYNYCWWRDGGYVSKAMDEAGLYENAGRFLEFARSVPKRRRLVLPPPLPGRRDGEHLAPASVPPDRPDRHRDRRGLAPLQARCGDPDVLVDLWPMVKGAANFLEAFRDTATRPSRARASTSGRSGSGSMPTRPRRSPMRSSGPHGSPTRSGRTPAAWRRAAVEIRESAVRTLLGR